MKLWQKNLLLLLLAAIIVVVPLLLLPEAGFEGADGEAGDLIGEISPGYSPWFSPVLELPGGEVESLLFVLQAALGAGVAGWILGRMTLRKKYECRGPADR